MKAIRNTILAFTLTFAFAINTSLAQDVAPGMKAWGLSSLKLRFSPKSSFTVTQLTAFDMDGTGFQFLQVPLSFNRKIGNNMNVDMGFMPTVFKQTEGVKLFNRVFTEFDHKIRWGNLAMKQSVRAELHFPQLRKYRMRFIYTNKLSYRFRNAPLRLTPFIRNQIFWYQGGRDVQYYDEGELIAEQAPNGFHRFRVTIGVRMRLAKRLYGSAFYAFQREFNLPFSPERELNVPRPNGRVQAPFNNYSLVGIGISYTLKLY